MIKHYITLALLVLGFTSVMAQSTVRGTILDENATPLPGAHIYLENTDYSALTSIDGDYIIYNVPEGMYTLVISYIGYNDVKESIVLEGGKDLIKNIQLEEGVILNEIVVNGRLEGQAKALSTQKNNLNITEVIASEQIERFPDANIGDALKRVSGINVQYDQGEARFANIRGTAPELNSITINGERVPSAEAEKRYVQLDLIPSDVISNIELSKAITPDMDADAIGGSINLVTQKAAPGMRIKGKLGSGYSFLTEKPILKGQLSLSSRFANDKIGVIFNASALDKHVRSDNVETEWDYADENNKNGSAVPTDHQVRQYLLQRFRQSYSTTIDYQIHPNHNIYFNGMYNVRKDWENRYRLRFKDIEMDDDGQMIAEIRRQTKGGISDNQFGRLEDQRMQSFGGGGEHFFNDIKVTWTLTSMKASEDRPNERYVSFRAKKEPVSLNLSDLSAPIVTPNNAEVADLSSGYSLKELTEEFQFTEEEDLNARLDIQIPILFGKNSSQLKIGGRYKDKTKSRDNRFKEYEPIDEDAFIADALNNISSQNQDNFTAGDYSIGSFVKKEYLGDINLNEGFESEDVLEEFAGNFDANESVIGAYAMYTQNIGSKWSMIGGLRYEMTSIENKGFIFNGDELVETGEQKNDYSNVLPGIHLKYSPTNWTNVKFAWTNSIARPNYFDLIPYQEIEQDDNEIKIGNANLEATTSSNIDLLVEHYFKNIGVLSGGLFYKNLSNVIAEKTSMDYQFEGNVYDRFTQPVNAGNADLYGFEIGVQRRLDFLPSVFSNLSLYLNYTYSKSELKDITLEDREDEKLPLVGTPENVFNASLAYDTKVLDVRVSFNFADAFIEEYDDETFYDRWYDKVTYLDINADYKINKNWKIYASVNNILDQPLRYYQGHKDRNMQIEYYGIHTKLGVKFNFK